MITTGTQQRRPGRRFLAQAAALVALTQLNLFAEPVVLKSDVVPRDAPEVLPRDHGAPGQNAMVEWAVVADGPAPGGDALYLSTSVVREESISGETALLTYVDLNSGEVKSVYPSTRIRMREKRAALDLALDEDEPIQEMSVGWPWGRAVCGARGPDGGLYFGTLGDEKHRPMLVRYLPREDVFEELGKLPATATGMATVDEKLWTIDGRGELRVYDEIGGLETAGRVPGPEGTVSRLAADVDGWFYTSVSSPLPRLYAFRVQGKRVQGTRLLDDMHIERLMFHEERPGPLCELVTGTDGRFSTRWFALHRGQALPLQSRPERSRMAEERGYELLFEPDVSPLSVSVRRAGGEWRRFPLAFEGTGWDKIKVMRPGPDGNFLYGAGWPVAWIWRFDPASDTFRILGRHYVFYEIHPWQDELWVAGYWGIKLLRWRPEEPWTFDYQRHYFNKTYAANSSPWGDKGVSNPRLVCKFRYLKKLNCRRPGGMTIGPDGRAYVGARTPAVEYFDSRYGGAINWYDPETETIGQVREPFLHHSVRDVCAAGGRYIAAAASAYICMYEPLPEDFSRGKFVLYDTQTGDVALDCSPLDTPLSYAEEGEPGRIVVAGASAGKYAADGYAGAFFIFDTGAMAVTHVILTRFRVRWAEYNVLPFERGPDNRIYFYGNDGNGVALCRIDSRNGRIDAVLRGPGITDAATYNNPGAAFAFLGDRVYFGSSHLVSVPKEALRMEE